MKKDNYSGPEFPEMTPEEIQAQVDRTQALSRSLDENPEEWDKLLKRVQAKKTYHADPKEMTEDDEKHEEAIRRWKVLNPQRGRTERGSKVRPKS